MDKDSIRRRVKARKSLLEETERMSAAERVFSRLESLAAFAMADSILIYNSLPDEEIDRVSDVTVHTDGRTYTVPAGTQIRLTPGESIHIQQRLYHDFTVEPGGGPVLLGEVSQCNDDNTDNRFNPPMGRFPAIEEDEPPYRLLCNEYPPAP